MKYKKYLIKKGKLDLLSSLKSLDKKIVDEKLEEYDLENVAELKDYIIEEFETCLDMSKEDVFTQLYFVGLLEHENSDLTSVNEQDIESLCVFVYNNGDQYSYYIPLEIKMIIKRILSEIFSEERLNLEMAANMPIEKDLKKLLNLLSIKDLKHIGELFLINRLSNKPKKKLVDIIYNNITNEDKLSEVIGRFIDKEFNLLKELINNKGTIQNNKIGVEKYLFLYKLGIIFLFREDNKFYISMADDIYNIVKKMDLGKFEKMIDENTKAYNLVKAMIELYGVVSYDEASHCYSLYYENGKDLEIPTNALYFCDRQDDIVIMHTNHNLYFINSILDNEEIKSILDEIVNRQREIKRKPIKIDDLLKYLDNNYYEDNASKKKFKKYLRKKGIQDEQIENIIINISKVYRLGNIFIGMAFEMLEEYGVDVTNDDVQEALNYLMDIYNNTRIWSNNGWTPIELMKENY